MARKREPEKRNHNPTFAKDDPRNPYRVGQTDANGRIICGGRSRAKIRAGAEETRCQLSPMANGRCRFHGGLVPKGAANPMFKTGRYSKYVPERLIDKYEESLQDPRLIELRDEIALIDTRLKQCVERTDRGESEDFWLALDAMWSEFISAVRRGDAVKQTELIFPINDLISKKSGSERGWKDIAAYTEVRRKLVETEQKRLQMAGQFVQVDRVITMMAAMILAIKEIAYANAEPQVAKKIVISAGERYRQLINNADVATSYGEVVDG